MLNAKTEKDMELGYAPKHVLIANRIREKILKGRIKVGERLKPDNELAAEYGVNKRTVANGMMILVEEGLIARAPGRGSEVLRREQVRRTSGAVGMFLYNSGHLYDTIAAEATMGLMRRGLYPVWVNQSLFSNVISSPEYASHIQRFMEQMLDDSPYGMIVDGDRFMPFDFLRRNVSRIRNLVFCDHFLYSKKINGAKYVLIDRNAVGRKAAEYLYRRGHRHITFFPNAETPAASSAMRHPQSFIIDGMKEFCLEAGCRFNEQIPERLRHGEAVEEVLRDCFGKEDAPTGCLLLQDVKWVRELEPVLSAMGLSCPRDLSVIGCNNTPWSEEAHPRLTSVAMREKLMARRAIELLTGETDATEIAITPELVERESVMTR